MAVMLVRRRFSVDDYHRMAETGILTEQDRVELLDGEIVEMSPIGGGHANVVDTLTDILVPLFGQRAKVRVQNPVRLDAFSEPQPDVSVVRRRAYGNQLPVAEDVFLIVEVSDSTLLADLNVKVRLYAQAAIPEYLVIDLRRNEVIRHTEPRNGSYQQVERLGRDASFALVALPDVIVAVGEIDG